MKYCEKCGNKLFDEAVMCPKCKCSVGASKGQSAQEERSNQAAKGTLGVLAGIAIIFIFVLLVLSQI